jgi:hypothetical protein
MQHIRNGALMLVAAMLSLGCATHQADQNNASKESAKEAQKEANKNPNGATVPASIFQGYNVTGGGRY